MAVGSWVRSAVGTSSAARRARAAATVDVPDPPRAPMRVMVVVMGSSFVASGDGQAISAPMWAGVARRSPPMRRPTPGGAGTA